MHVFLKGITIFASRGLPGGSLGALFGRLGRVVGPWKLPREGFLFAPVPLRARGRPCIAPHYPPRVDVDSAAANAAATVVVNNVTIPSRQPLGACVEASGDFGGLSEGSWGLVRAALERPVGGSYGHLGGKGSKCQFGFPFLDLSWGSLGPSWEPQGPA
eukprot:9488559-Pyramimonas_sp.AAC.1